MKERITGMRVSAAAMAAICLLAAGCATFFRVFPGQGSTFYDRDELALLDKTTKAIEFDYGYDQELELDYVFPQYQGFEKFKPADRELARALEGVDGTTLIAYSEKIYRLKRITELRMERCRASGDWKAYTFISKYLAPPLGHYASEIEKQAMKKDRSYQQRIEKRRNELEDRMRHDRLRQEFEDIWKNDYNS